MQLVSVTVRVASILACKAYSSDAQVAWGHVFQETLVIASNSLKFLPKVSTSMPLPSSEVSDC